MQTLKLSVSLPDDTHPEIELRLSANDASCDVVIALPVRLHDGSAHIVVPGTSARNIAEMTGDDSGRGTSTASDSSLGAHADNDRTHGADDDYVLGGYAGI